ncbi:unnamed protein product [Cuscuta europaea]|uniref:Aminotransferase-like plant mobile domain-containing protein n=1 Tax=Cuscuta europaea TaxID=41803 RepID=A0A9P1E8L4_CUSEU|nr:unnamed protein product [Cuscuta europaea]
MIQFTEQQKNEVEKFGFGSLLSLNIPEMPSKLAYWVVRSFDPKNCKLTGCDDILQVKGEDVQLVLGFPRGSKSIVKKNMLAKCAVLHEWRALFPKNENQITPTEVCKAMLECTQGGIWFIRHFLLLLISVVIDSYQNGYVNHQILNNLETIEGIKELNWCEYVMSTLIENRKAWENKKFRIFIGLILILMVRCNALKQK